MAGTCGAILSSSTNLIQTSHPKIKYPYFLLLLLLLLFLHGLSFEQLLPLSFSTITKPFQITFSPLKSRPHALPKPSYLQFIQPNPNPNSPIHKHFELLPKRSLFSQFSHCKISLKPHFSVLFIGLSSPFSSFASEAPTLPTEEVSSKINLESILVSIDNFFNRYPFFVATVAFIWLIVIPLTEEYLQKYKFMSAINAFKKLQDDPNSQLLDIRDTKSLAVLGSPNLKFLSKSVAQVEFREGNEEGFVKRVLENFGDPFNTTVCIIDNFDGNSLKAAELLVKNGFKEAYAIRGGIRGEKGWLDIQETLLPQSVHIFPTKRVKNPKQHDTNGGITRHNENNDDVLSINTGSIADNNNKDLSSTSPTVQSKVGERPMSPYPNYPDFRAPSSPTPSKPK